MAAYIIIWSLLVYVCGTGRNQSNSNGIRQTGLLTACKQDQDEFHPDPARKVSANMYDIYHCCVYSEKLLMMDRGTVRNMYNFIPK